MNFLWHSVMIKQRVIRKNNDGAADSLTYSNIFTSLLFYTVTLFKTTPAYSLTSTRFTSALSLLAIILLFFIKKRRMKIMATRLKLLSSSTNPRARRCDRPLFLYAKWSHKPNDTTLKPTRVPQTPKAIIQEPQDSSAPPVTTVIPATETNPFGNVTVSDFGSYFTVWVRFESAERSSGVAIINELHKSKTFPKLSISCWCVIFRNSLNMDDFNKIKMLESSCPSRLWFLCICPSYLFSQGCVSRFCTSIN